MTREERLELLKQIEKDIYVPSIESTFLDDAKSCAIHSAIEELEQEPVIDKIKENIQFIKDKCLPNNIAEEYEQKGLQEALDIIDKYKAETENP